MATTLTPNMNLTIPVVENEPGPDYAFDINAALDKVDEHSHLSGSGVPIVPQAMNINSDLPFQGNNATFLRSTRFQPQNSPLVSSSSADLGCFYVAGADAYYNDTLGNQVRLTQNGNVSGGAGSITGLSSPASASYVTLSQSFVFQSGVNLAADVDARSVIFRNAGVSSFGLTLNPPSAMGANLSMTLPVVSSATSFMAIDSSGNMSAYAPVNQGLSRSNMQPIGQVVSSTSGGYSTGVAAHVTGQIVTLTTTGRPVALGFVQTGGATAYFGLTGGGVVNATFAISRLVGSTDSPISISNVYSANVELTGGGRIPFGSMSTLDFPNAGTYSYSLDVTSITGGTAEAANMSLFAYEL